MASKEMIHYYNVIGVAFGNPIHEYEYLKTTYDLLEETKPQCTTDDERQAVKWLQESIGSLLNNISNSIRDFGLKPDIKGPDILGIDEGKWCWELKGIKDKS